MANLQRVVQRLEPGRVERPVVAAEIRVRGAGGDDQLVVGQLAIAQTYALRVRLHRRGLGQEDGDIALCAQDATDG